ncbi:MAG: protein kinase [Sandaracinaceae bacterium]|jgi:serine/threonine protein kinase|nr:protein kinase [Sandaracinaceae bacterium]
MTDGVDEAADALTGTILAGRFEVVELLARGGMGKVYRAVQMPLGRPVALKVLDIKGGGASRADFRGRFFLEAATAAKLSHPNTVTIFDYGMSGDSIYFIAMELVEGVTLAEIIKRKGPVDPARVAHMGVQICGSLSEAHAMGVVHRDMKPSNVLLTHRGHDPDFVKVVDFGLVKVLGDETENDFTQTGMMMGTPKYMSPEQISGKEVTEHSDMYSLGAVLFFALTGKPPFDAASKFDILTAHVNNEPPRMRDVFADCQVSEALEGVVRRCMAKVPEDRYRSMHEVSRALRACEQELRGTVKKFDRRSRPRAPTGTPEALAEAIQSGDTTSMTPTPGATPTSGLVALPGSHPIRSMSPPMPSLPAAPIVPTSFAPPALTSTGSNAIVTATPSAAPSPSGSHRPIAAPVTIPIVQNQLNFLRSALIASVAVNVLALSAMVYSIFSDRNSARETAVANESRVRVITDPPGAHVTRNGRDLGDAPVNLMIPANEEWTVELQLNGYAERSIVVSGGQDDVRVRLERGVQ